MATLTQTFPDDMDLWHMAGVACLHARESNRNVTLEFDGHTVVVEPGWTVQRVWDAFQSVSPPVDYKEQQERRRDRWNRQALEEMWQV